jgi:hypothetical protein
LDKKKEDNEYVKIDTPEGNSNDTLLADSIRIQYSKLSEDWRQFNNILWGIPSVAVSIMVGIIAVAYQPGLAGWPRFVALAIGSLFLFALALEVAKKRLHMILAEDVLTEIQNSKIMGLGEFKLSWGKAYDYWDTIKDSSRHAHEDGLFRSILKHKLHAPTYLLWIIYLAAISVGILAVLHLVSIIAEQFEFSLPFELP